LVTATRRVLAREDVALTDIDPFEINEAFASLPVVWMHEIEGEACSTRT
jgi:acetyl-CoA acyltransferase